MSRRGAQRGQTLPMVAVALVILMGAVGFAVDVGYHQYQQRMQQTATDTAALSGAQELLVGDWFAAARKDASINGYADNTNATTCPATPAVGTVCVEPYNPPTASDAYSGNHNAVEVDITVYHPTFFESVFNINNVPVTTKAVAVLKPQSSPNCMYVLSGGANFNAGQNGGTLNAPTCGLIFNGGANFNNATVDAASISCAATCSNGTFTGASPVTTAPASDPCAALSYCAHMMGYKPPTCTQTATASNNQNITIQPGCYSGMNLKKANSVTFNCGLYVIEGTLDASATGNGSYITIGQQSGCGVTFFITGSGSVVMKNANINLSAPTSGDYNGTTYTAGEQNVLFYQDPSDTSAAVFQSASCSTCTASLNGMLYFPSANLNYNQGQPSVGGNGAFIVAGTLNFNGTISGITQVPGGPQEITDLAVLGE